MTSPFVGSITAERRSRYQGLPTGKGTEFREVRLGVLRKSPGNKRVFNERRAANMAAKIEDYLLGVIFAAERDGSLWVIDGWHRVGAARLAGMETIRVLVVHGYSPADDARAFDLLNTLPVRIGPGDEFWARVDYGDPVATEVLAIARSHGVTIAGAATGTAGRSPSTTRAYAALQFVLSRHGSSRLSATLAVLRAAWPNDPRSLEANPILWVSAFIAVYDIVPSFSLDRLTLALSRIDIAEMARRVKAIDGARGIRGPQADKGGRYSSTYGGVSPREVLLGIYNHGLRDASGNRLPEASHGDLRRRAMGHNPWDDEVSA